MNISSVNLLDVLAHYVAGYFPMYGLPDAAGQSEFFWDRWPVRAVLPVNQETVDRARHMTRRVQRRDGGPFEIRHTTAVEEVIAQLQTVREQSWVQGEVIAIYRALHAAGVLVTVEAWTPAAGPGDEGTPHGPPRLVGALLGIVLPGVFIAETMYGLVPEASKFCLCRLVEDCAADGFTLIDVQTPHAPESLGTPSPRGKPDTAHPCIRLGETHMPVEEFLEALHTTWSGAFSGDIAAWLYLARSAQRNPVTAPGRNDPRRFLRHAGGRF